MSCSYETRRKSGGICITRRAIVRIFYGDRRQQNNAMILRTFRLSRESTNPRVNKHTHTHTHTHIDYIILYTEVLA